jgi:hypothetical protein
LLRSRKVTSFFKNVSNDPESKRQAKRKGMKTEGSFPRRQ